MDLASRISVITFWLFVFLCVALAPWPELAGRVLAGESGLVELATVGFALWGAVVAMRIVMDGRALPDRALVLWFGLFVLGLIVLAGEEISWGQSWFRWETPAEYAALNRQKETNLHNLHSMAESLPKTLLLAAALLGGIVWPLVARRRGIGPVLPGTFGWLWPSAAIWPAAALAWVTRIAERVMVWTNLEDFAYGQYDALRETIELFGVLYVLAYLMNVRRRTVSQASPDA